MHAYPWAILYGLYFYLIFQIMFVVRFGQFNLSVNILDAFIWAVGIISALLFMFFAKRLGVRWKLLFIPLVIAIPFAYIGALGGGLLGVVGILIGGSIPFFVFLPLGYWILKRVASGNTKDMDSEHVMNDMQ